MRKMKRWLVERYLPEYCRQTILEDNTQLRALVRKLEQENNSLSAYINGMETAMRLQKQVIINATDRRDR